MGTWGYGLYSDDVTRDVKDIYVDKLRRGKSGMQASKEMIAEFKWALDDEDDAPLFWFAMADTQWNYGRLQNEVKTQALYYLNDIKNLQRWEFENPKMFYKRKEVLNSLYKKLMTQQPPEKMMRYQKQEKRLKSLNIFRHQSWIVMIFRINLLLMHMENGKIEILKQMNTDICQYTVLN